MCQSLYLDIIHFSFSNYNQTDLSDISSIIQLYMFTGRYQNVIILRRWLISHPHKSWKNLNLKTALMFAVLLCFWTQRNFVFSCVLTYRNNVNGFQMYLSVVGRPSVSEAPHVITEVLLKATCQEAQPRVLKGTF